VGLRMQRIINMRLEDEDDLLGVLIREQEGTEMLVFPSGLTHAVCSCSSTASSRACYSPCSCPRTHCTNLAHRTSLGAPVFCRPRCARPCRACLRDTSPDA
jgi:hypothetical protein